jgi:hypothetical protein
MQVHVREKKSNFGADQSIKTSMGSSIQLDPKDQLIYEKQKFLTSKVKKLKNNLKYDGMTPKDYIYQHQKHKGFDQKINNLKAKLKEKKKEEQVLFN